MISREQYDEIISTFLVELNYICHRASENDLRALPRLTSEIDGYLADLRDINNDAGQTLYTAFAYVDEFVHADWKNVAATGYEAYKITQLKCPQEGTNT